MAMASRQKTNDEDDDALFLGLDFGTSGARATVVDAKGDIVTETTAKYPAIVDGGKGGDGVPEGGWAEAWKGALWALLDQLPAGVAPTHSLTHSLVFLCGKVPLLLPPRRPPAPPALCC